LAVGFVAWLAGCSADTTADARAGLAAEDAMQGQDLDPDWTLQPAPAPVQGPDRGSIAGHVSLVGTPPGNRVIRMGMDPACGEAVGDRVVTEEGVVATREGDLANVFVRLAGDFSPTPPPANPVQIDQTGCMYTPHVVGVQVGQTVEVHNGDDAAHNLHATSRQGNGFNVGQPVSDLVYRFQPEAEEFMMLLGCDIHRWMSSYIGIVSHPYFSVSSGDGTFSIANVPPGTYTIHAWHETFGDRATSVEVRAGEAAMVDFSYQTQ
jgi:plastocyanin